MGGCEVNILYIGFAYVMMAYSSRTYIQFTMIRGDKWADIGIFMTDMEARLYTERPNPFRLMEIEMLVRYTYFKLRELGINPKELTFTNEDDVPRTTTMKRFKKRYYKQAK